MGPKLLDCCKPEHESNKEWQDVKADSGPWGWQGPAKEARELKGKEKNHEKRVSEPLKQV